MKKINLIILTSSNSMICEKEDKMTAKRKYISLIENTLKLAKEYQWNKITVVTQYEEIYKMSKAYNATVAWNLRSDLGLSYSMKLGIDNGTDADAFCFLVCNQSYLKENTLKSLVDLFNQTDKGIACVKYGDTKANIVIFNSNYLEQLQSLRGDNGPKKIVLDNIGDVVFLEI